MPIRFQCGECGQKLSVGSKKAGARVKCPKCAKVVEVPQASSVPAGAAAQAPTSKQPVESEATSNAHHHPAPEAADHPTETPPDVADSFSQFTVYDEEAEWVYETEDDDQYDDVPHEVSDYEDTYSVDREKLAVSRKIIYVQGGLLGGVALLGFLLGLLMGWSTSTETVGPPPAEPCMVSGTITFSRGNADPQPDQGALVMLLPQSSHPEQGRKLKVEEFLEAFPPSADAPAEGNLTLSNLQSFGGKVVRTDEQGTFQIELPDRGVYYLLILSNNKEQRGDGPKLSRNDVFELGQYFFAADELLNKRRYRWSIEQFDGDRDIQHSF